MRLGKPRGFAFVQTQAVIRGLQRYAPVVRRPDRVLFLIDTFATTDLVLTAALGGMARQDRQREEEVDERR